MFKEASSYEALCVCLVAILSFTVLSPADGSLLFENSGRSYTKLRGSNHRNSMALSGYFISLYLFTVCCAFRLNGYYDSHCHYSRVNFSPTTQHIEDVVT